MVVDDGSSCPADFWGNLRGCFDFEVLHHPENLGKGAALKTGLKHVEEAYPSACGVVTFDADGQHLAEDVIRVAARLEAEADAVVLGTRDFSRPVPVRNRIGNVAARLTINLLLGRRWRDVQCGLRGIPRRYLRTLSTLKGDGFDWETRALFQLHDLGARFLAEPVATVYASGWDGTSHFRPVLDSLWFLRVVLERFLSKNRRKRPPLST